MTFYWYSGRTRLDLPMQRSSGPCRLAWLLAAALIALLFGVVAPAQALPQPSAHLHHYVYDAAVHDSVLTDTATERGPPVAWDTDQDRTAVGRASNGVLARPAMATVSDNYDHDGSPQFVQAAQGGNTDARPVGALTGQLSSVHPGQVAAKAGPALGPARNTDLVLDSFRKLGPGRNAHVRTAGSVDELKDTFNAWTVGAERIASRGPKVPDVYRLPDGGVIQWRTSSGTGGPTIDIFPVSGRQRTVHLADGVPW